ncbi:transketolase [Helicobacter cinaedi]|uniref:transketolase n=1 Tax=Helicobacter cinaedi TaxID=213 RepID=UPI001F2FDE73|nr:transketolase [Helicobacter cinaedi]BDB67088.1 transketolase [Helicobacter cinaedi]
MRHFNIIATNIRKNILRMNTRAKVSHTGSAFSIVEILTILYFKVLRLDIKNPKKIDRDRFILSKGHASSALYATLAQKGFFDCRVLKRFYAMRNGVLPGHLDMESINGIEVSSGSLGMGLSLGIGIALALKNDNLDSRVFILCGDGELNEGSMWEAILFVAHHKLEKVVLIVDYNKLQGFGETNCILNLEPLGDKFRVFNWNVLEVDGHNFNALNNAFSNLSTTKPNVIIAHTIKGKGVDFMENKLEWHYKSPNLFEFKKAMNQLNKGGR